MNKLLEYNGIFTLAWHPRCPGGYASGYRVHHLNATLTTSRGPRPENYVSQYGVHHPSQALTAAREQRSLMYGIPPPHSMLEEDSRYPRNALGTRVATYWLPNTWEYPSALLETSAPEDAHCVLTVRRTYRGDYDVPRA